MPEVPHEGVFMGIILIVQCNRLVSGVQYPGLSSIAAHVKQAGHAFALFDSARYSPVLQQVDCANDFYTPPISLQFKPFANGIVSLPAKLPLQDLVSDLIRSIEGLHPDVIGFSCFSDDWSFALFLIRHIHTLYPHIPLVVGGVHATINPSQIIKHPQITAVCIGEGERPLVELMDSLAAGSINTTIRNLWFRSGHDIIRTPPRPACSLQERAPYADWEMYDDIHFVYPYEGKLYRRGSVNLSRGCPYACRFCINDFYLRLGYRVRYKPIDFAIAELKHLKETYRLEFLRFWDESFLAVPEAYLREFAHYYTLEVNLPFTIETTANTITNEKAALLVDMGCQSVSIGIETANEDYRRKFLKKNVTNEHINRAFSILARHNIRRVANFMFLLPNQTIKDMYLDIRYCQELHIESPSPRIFYPYLGTGLREYCLEHGLINMELLNHFEDEEAIQSLEDLDGQYATFKGTVLNFSDSDVKESTILLENFIMLQETPTWLHRWLLGLLYSNTYEARIALDGISTSIFNKRYAAEKLEVFP